MQSSARAPRLASCFATLLLGWLGLAAAHAQSQSDTPAAAPPVGPTSPPAATSAPDAAAPSPAPSNTPAPPPAYGYPPGYAPPSPYYPPPGYYPPPSYYPPPGYYPPAPTGPPPGYHEHDGFYMRLSMGIGYLHTSRSYLGAAETISGVGLGMDLAFGAAVARNLLIFGEIAATSAVNPNVKHGETSPSATDTSVDLIGFGPGLAYYFQSLNLYLSGSLQFSKVTANDNRDTSDSTGSTDLTDTGFGMSFMAGKEWWVSTNWGLGLASMLHFASMKQKDFDGRMTATALSILFSATYN